MARAERLAALGGFAFVLGFALAGCGSSSDSCAGEAGCECLPDDTCTPDESGMSNVCDVESGQCVHRMPERPAPDDPQCYTPCSNDLVLENGEVRYCDHEGLMAGCIGLAVCERGSCLVPPTVGAAGSTRSAESDAPRDSSCEDDLDCPDFQACLEGNCYSECEVNSECPAAMVCDRRVCRFECNTSDPLTCPESYVCTSDDGAIGVCTPAPTSSSDTAPPPPARERFSLTESALSFTNNATAGAFSIVNNSDTPIVFSVRKVDHIEIRDSGRVRETEQPLFWLSMGEQGALTLDREIEVAVGPNETKPIYLRDAGNEALDQWEGHIEVFQPGAGAQTVWLQYTTSPDGLWAGNIYYLVDFDEGGDDAMAAWQAEPGSRSAAARTHNALLVQWADFASDPLFTLDEWMAVVDSTIQGSWKFPLVKEACLESPGANSKVLCYPYVAGSDPQSGVRVYTDSDSLRIPTGVVEMPFAMTLAQADPADPTRFSGRVDTARALQYPGHPAVDLEFAANPAGCETDGQACTVSIAQFDVTAHTGARYLAGDQSCGSGWYGLDEPWLVDAFTQGTFRDDGDGAGSLLRRECRDASFPTAPTSDSARHRNASLAGANPIPDGQRRERHLELLDGRLINQDTLFMLVRESFEARLAGADVQRFSGYGIVMLQRQPADLSAEDFEAAAEPEPAPAPPTELVEDSGDLQCAALGRAVTPADANDVAALLLHGRSHTAQLLPVSASATWAAHYLCHDTGRIDGGVPGSEPEPCPFDSQITYFLSTEDVAHDGCQGTETCLEGLCDDTPDARGTCEARLREMVNLRPHNFVVDPVFDCMSEVDGELVPDPARVQCSEDRQHLLAAKEFYLPPDDDSEVQFPALAQAIGPAFLYRTRFLNRAGKQLGFVPSECELGESTPYCFDPAAIESIRARVDCLIGIQRRFDLDRRPPGDLGPDRIGDQVDAFLFDNFGGRSDQGVIGFERMYAELLVMLGDDAFTRALASRFDLAGIAVGTFEGGRFEPDGIALPGGAGYELRSLYEAKQAYELVVDRFYRQSAILWEDLARPEGPELVNMSTIANYVGRVVLASTKKAKVTSEIAKRYQGFGRPALARHAIEREYARAYLESVVLHALLKELSKVAVRESSAFLELEMTRTQNLYRSALASMRETYQALSDELSYFGDPADFIPFPAPHRFDVVSPQIMIERAADTMRIAKERDDRALASNRQFDTDAAQFQSELRRVELQYENELADLCGTFEGEGDTPYPAIPKYAQDSVLATFGGNPCGLVGPRPGEAPGQIYQARREVEIAATDLRLAVQETRDILAQKAIEERRVEAECRGRVNIASIRYEGAGEVVSLESLQHTAEEKMSAWERRLAVVDRAASVANAFGMAAQQAASTVKDCANLNPFDIASKVACGLGAGSTAAFGLAARAETMGLAMQAFANAENAALQREINHTSELIGNVEATTEARAAFAECRMCEDWLDGTTPGDGVDDPADCPSGNYVDGPLVIESKARVDTLVVGMARASLNGLRAELALSIAQGRLAALEHRAARLIAQATEAEQLLLDVEAARNDPNIRLLRNADVLDADKAFHDALIDAYRATRVFEYYTAQSYGPKQDLFLARLAGRGEHSIENYLLDLQRALNDFENLYGRPDTRLHVVSLRDDVLRIPRTDELGTPYTDAERIAMFREALVDPSRLNARGYLAFPFAIGLDATSPLTAVHKIEHIEAEIQGSGVGDRLGRVSLTPRGTATVRSLEGANSYLRLPAIRAEIDAFFNGVKPAFIDPELYKSVRLRERPLVNSLWELGLNLRDDAVNRDIRPEELTDIRLYVYYEDFTQWE